MSDTEQAAAFAITQAKRRGEAEISPDDLLRGCLQVIAQFGVVRLGPWLLDLETLGIDWMSRPDGGLKVAYSEPVVEIFDRAARISRSDGAGTMQLRHLLAAFAPEEGGLMGELKRVHGITSGTWRAAVAQLDGGSRKADGARPSEYLTPEEAAQALSVHVQTLRAYVRSGKLPALRLAGERSIRIRRADLEKIFEPVQPEEEKERQT